MVAIPGGPVRTHGRQCCRCAHKGREQVDGFVDHLCSPFSAVLSVASCSNSAESFFWISGLYAVYLLRERGLSVRGLEAGEGVGGTWYWNRYPGACCDVPSVEYSYGFSPELEQDWEWSEFFPGQEELERYLNHVADRFDIRREIRFSKCVTAATFDEGCDRWVVETDYGDRYSARFVVMATGALSVPTRHEIEGIESFGGLVLQTSMWPTEVDLAGTRIALVGTGSSGVQAAPNLAKVADHLYVLQRTATFTWPSNNGPMDPIVQQRVKGNYRELRTKQRLTPGATSGLGGVPILVTARPDNPILQATEDELAGALEDYGFSACRLWSDTGSDPDANERAVELYREMIRRTVKDPQVAEALSPRGYPLGCKRPVLDVGYFETFNRSNVTLVDLRKGGIEGATPTGISYCSRRLRRGRHRPRYGLRRNDGCPDARRHTRPRRSSSPQRLGRWPAHTARPSDGWLPKPFHRDGTRKPLRPGQYGGGGRTPCRVDRRLYRPHEKSGPYDRRAIGRSPSRMGAARQSDGKRHNVYRR